MTQLTAKDITNYYLYGDKSTPSNLVDSGLIRSENDFTRINIDAKELMNTGAGRFAVGSQFELVKRFFDQNISISANTYNKFQINDLILQNKSTYFLNSRFKLSLLKRLELIGVHPEFAMSVNT